MGPYPRGPQGTPGPTKPNLAVFTRLGGKVGWENCPTVRRAVLRGPQNCFTGVPAGNQVLQCLLQCPRTPHNHYGTPPWGPSGTRGPAKSKKSRNLPVSGGLKKTQVENPPKAQNPQKTQIPPKGGRFSKKNSLGQYGQSTQSLR